MSRFCILVILLPSASGLTIRGDAPALATAVDFTCPLVPVVNLAFSGDEAMEKREGKVADAPSDQKQRALQEATASYQVKKTAFEDATADLYGAIDAILQVPAADAAMLQNVSEGKVGKDTLVAFYAPWCPHCQTFVLHDEDGIPANAPLEVLRKDFAKADATKNVNVIRADVTKLGQKSIPSSFVVQGIPAVYFVNAKGEETQFQGNPHNTSALKAFVEDHRTM